MDRSSSKQRKRRKDAGKPKTLTEAHKLKMQTARKRKKAAREKTEIKQEQKDLQETIKRLEDRVAKATKEDAQTYTKYQKTPSIKNFNIWLQANTKLLNCVTSLRAHENRTTDT